MAATALGGCGQVQSTPAPVAPAATVPAARLDAERLKPFQFLYGSGEAAALSIQAYHALVGHAREMVAHRPAESVVLAPGATLDAPAFLPCGDRPLAAVFDVDETMLANLGFEARAATGEPYSDARWKRWEETGADKVAPIPGAVFAVNALRGMGVTVIFNTNRTAETAAQTAAALKGAGLGAAVHGQTLFLAGDDATGSKKDGRRATISALYCVIAMGGDQLGDFSDLFNAAGLTPRDRRARAGSGRIAQMWGNGWFVLPNPVYGAALKGGLDDIFPMDKRWIDPPEETK